MDRPQTLTPPPRSLARQAALRLVFSLALVMLVVGGSTVLLYRQALAQANAERINALKEFYAARLAQIERDWELHARDFRVRVEYTRLLEDVERDEIGLQAYLTVQGGNRRFQYLLVEDKQGAPRFSFGKELDLAALPLPPGQDQGWYGDPASGRLYRVFVERIWLGAQGMGRIGLFFAVDNALLYAMTAPGVLLTAFRGDTPVASSAGTAGLEETQVMREQDFAVLPWTGDRDAPVSLRISAPPKPLFTMGELALAGSSIPLLDGMILWLGLGTWLLLHARRLRALGEAVREFSTRQALTAPFRASLAQTHGPHADEIRSVADALETLAEASVRREVERRAEDAQRRLMAMVFASSGEGIMIADADRRVLAVNLAFTQITGYAEGEVLGQAPPVLASHLESPGFYENVWAEIAATGRWKGEARERRKDGTPYTIWLSVATVRDAAGEIRYYVGIFSDISERKAAEVALRHSRDELCLANAELAKAARLKDEFMASMSHELRTPLTAVLNLSEALREETFGPLAPEQADALRIIEESGRHLLQLINDILDLSKIEAGQLRLDPDVCQLKDVCESAWGFIKSMAIKKKLQYTFSMRPDLLECEADARRLMQILVNLLGNAVKFTPQGGRVGLEVEGDAARGEIRLVVWDTGIGIAPENLARLFVPFVQLDSSLSRQHAGTGLGLALVRRMTELHGGRVDVESQPGQGSRFTVSLPWRKAPPPGPGPQTVQAARADGKAKPLVLLVEDNEINARSYCSYLERRGYRVALATWGEEAVRLAKELRPDIVLMDIQMPDMDGLEATRRIRADSDARVARVPIIALTALAMSGDRERCLEAGANEYLSKPVSLKRLQEVIGTCLRQADAGEEA